MLRLDYGQALVSQWEERALKIAAELFDKDGKTAQPFAESIQPLGLLARPKDPDPDGEGGFTGAGLVYGNIGDALFGWPTTDPRILEKIPELPPGSTVIYACNGSLVFLNGETGTVQILVPYDDGGTAKSHSLSFDVEEKSIQLRHGDGMGFSVTAGGKNSFVLNNKGGDVFIELNDEEINVSAPKVNIVGGLIAGEVASAQGVITGVDFPAWKTAVDANFATLLSAAGSSVVPTVSPTASLAVTPSAKVKASL